MAPNSLTWLTCHVVPWRQTAKRQRKDHTRISIHAHTKPTLQGTNISHHGKRNIILKSAFGKGYVGFLEGICWEWHGVFSNTFAQWRRISQKTLGKQIYIIPVLCESFSCVKISMYDPEWPTIDRPISWYWTFFVASKNIHHGWWQPTRRCWLNSWLGIRWCLSLYLFSVSMSTRTHFRALSLSFSLPETALSIAVAVFVTSGQESMYEFYNVICPKVFICDMIWSDLI